MSTTDPLTLRLPSWLCDSFDLARVIANEHRSLGRSTGVCRFDQFAMRSHERALVKTVRSAIDKSSSRRADHRAT